MLAKAMGGLTGPVSRILAMLSGLPASGKTTLGRPLSVALGLPLLDKDDILNSLLESLGASTVDERNRLSRASDFVLQTLARVAQGAVVTSFWRQESLSRTAGTPTHWLSEVPDTTVVEVFCQCPPSVAAERFAARHRHPGHFDGRHSAAELRQQFEQFSAAGPLGIGPLIQVDTTLDVDIDGLAQAVRLAAAGME